MTSCAAPTSGWPDAMNMGPAHSPSTRKTGIPVASSPTNSVRKLVMSPASIDAWQLMTARTARGHGAAARLGNQPNQPDDIADQHQQAAGRQRRIIDPHRKPEIRGAMLVDPHRDFDDLLSVPGQGAAKNDPSHSRK